MKTIGILLRKDGNKYSFPLNFLKILCEVRVIPILPDITSVNNVDGVILPGGIVEEDNTLDLIKYLHKIDKPTLGICLGMQEMGKALKGIIVRNENDNHLSKMKYSHEINIRRNTKLYSILKKDKILVNSRHLYKVLVDEKYISATCNEVIEAIEDKNKRFFVGVQFHIEDLLDDINSRKIVNAFVKSL